MPCSRLSAGLLGLLGLLVLPFLVGCGDETTPVAEAGVPPPIADCTDAFECALRVKLPEVAPENHDDLHNVFKLSDNIHSGGEPLTKEALERLAERGIKTILSVDGKVPDAQTARELGMRYVHVPIRYGGMRPDEMMKIAKTFRELPGPFYVHCFHGKHRGPTGAAVGRIALDGVSREEALAEMRQWCGAAGKYDGLYRTIALGDIPSAAKTKAFTWGFDEAHPMHGIREGMIRMTRSWDLVKDAQKRGWQDDPQHPDIDMVHEAELVDQAFAAMAAMKELTEKPADYQAWMKDAVAATKLLHEALVQAKAGAEGAADVADQRFTAVNNLCSACHKPYRNAPQ